MMTKISPPLRIPLLALVASGLLTVILMSVRMSLFEAYLYDFRMRNQGNDTKEIDVVLISSGEETSPPTMEQHYKVLQYLSHSPVKSITFIENFSESFEQRDPKNETFAKRFSALANQVIKDGKLFYIGTKLDVTGEEILPPFPLSKLPHYVAILHKDAAVFSEDKVTRRALLSINGEPTLHTLLADGISNRPQNFKRRGIIAAPEVKSEYFMINYRSDTREGKHPFKVVKYEDILDGKVANSLFKNKIALIGSINHDNFNDYAYTPFSREIFANPKLVVHANIIQTLINNDAIVLASANVTALITFILTAAVIFLVFRTTPAKGVASTLLISIIFIAISLLLFRALDFSLDLARPLLGIFFAYYIFVPYRLMMEYRRSSEFEKQHEILLQVDELKRNFMSLITHDLKTPVARIQGMAEVLARNAHAESDKQVVSEILSSTEELNRFITSILELATVESNHIKLQTSSKDINQVIEKCIDKLSFQAKNKNLKIESNLEPLFPLHIDATLISKVLTNLIDNAIKYSPESTTLTVSSQESDRKKGFIEISVADQGFGISTVDKARLFHKFYRPQNDYNMTTKGYGLGLYLSKFFVELHNGEIEVQSELGAGSTFTVFLPEQGVQISKGEPHV